MLSRRDPLCDPHFGTAGTRIFCHLLFGVTDHPVHGPAMLRFRCGPSALGSGEGYCHQLNMPHYRRLRTVAA